ncbi:hypothetical protein HS088_TW23G00086 [Tripterygium wilfordii]|uniref:Uncharacterized protein n=1 Tax=Tripterygium wilfordii TaxID=458696 RepID=A0A7J7BUK3_TRIWF|nr:uncharacterized protein LOC119993634 [Tripterygium wilfordii]KAF5725365.1 hypothetical protein HS088_TW23G00086 [Tripterygium wilfordii]
MIVKSVRATQDRVSDHDQIKKPGEELYSPKTVIDSGEFGEKKEVLKSWTEAEADMESGGSSEEVESPKSVAIRGRRRGKVRSQVVKIIEEDSHLGEDIREGLSAKDRIGAGFCNDNRSVRRPVLDFVILSRPILPSSPLGGKTSP